jgi:hypothetical protein
VDFIENTRDASFLKESLPEGAAWADRSHEIYHCHQQLLILLYHKEN